MTTVRRPIILLPDGSLAELPAGTVFLSGPMMVGATPGNVRYEMNSGGQAAFDPQVLHIAQIGAYLTLIEGFRFNNDPKAVCIQLGKSRGDGNPDSPDFFKKSTKGERIAEINTYGSSDHGFSHANYYSVSADYDSDNNNDQASIVEIATSAARTRGNGLKINSLSQVVASGPNMAAPVAGTDYKAILWLGPGGTSSANPNFPAVPVRFTSGTLVAAPVVDGLEYDEAGTLWITGKDSARRQFVVAKPLGASNVVSGLDAVVAATLGPDWAKITITPNADIVADPAFGLIVARLNISPSLPASAAVVGSINTTTGGEVAFNYLSQANRISIFMAKGTLLAGTPYTFSLMWRLA